MELWNFFDDEPYLDNPRLQLVNPRKKKARRRKAAAKPKRKKPMAKRRRRRAAPRRRARRRSYSMNAPRRRRRRSYRRNAYVPNPVRRRRRYRKNPVNVLGFKLSEIMYTGAGVIIQPMAERQLLNLLPASWGATTAGRWTAKVGSSVAVGWAAKKMFGGRIGELTMIVMGSNLLADAVDEFLPALPGMGAYMRPGMGAYARRNMGEANPGAIAGHRGAFTGVYPSLLKPMTAREDPFRAPW